MSTTSEPWRGDVHEGVAAWTRSAGRDQADPPDPPDPPDPQGDPSTSTRRRRSANRWLAPADPVALGPDADPESVARTILLDQLTGRARSRSELADKLAGKGVPDDVASRLLVRFEEVGLVDDDAFARAWIFGRGSAGGKGLARRALAQELRRKGIDDEVAREALDEVDPADEEEAARALVRKKLRSLSRVDDTTATRRLVGMLARKGYGAGQAYAVVKDELATSGREAPDVEV
ncbi:regulatory protein RecX [Nocardioides sp.]|uniref:regulatory protein RecX n=1 Tax=Nocardioides sp. TaxID=35761 RepID=UPI00271875B2|nr:regulatory protein RecX [Nocardioides sp.]MDO9454700.1 regulatory protein RecX [Nocardioides sp.]